MVVCAISGCTNRSGRDQVKFFRIPSVPKVGCPLTVERFQKQRAQWISRINRCGITDQTVTNNTRVCSVHFVSGCPAYHMHFNDPDWAPSLHLGHRLQVHVKSSIQRFQRVQQRSAHRKALASIENIPCAHAQNQGLDHIHNSEVQPIIDIPNLEGQAIINIPNTEDQEQAESGVACQTDLTLVDLNKVMSDLTVLTCQVRPAFFSEEHMSNDTKCYFYTGLESYAVLHLVFKLVSAHIKKNYDRKDVLTTPFQEFCATLSRLRLGLLEEDIADRMNISQGTVSKIFNKWIPVMAACLQSLLIWPTREVLKKTTPECFRDHFGTSVAVIIDCFEVRSEAPSALYSKGMMYSSYKHGHTVKFLLAISPQGTITYISRTWPGRSSDKLITEQCREFLDKLLPGDVVLADRGFDIGVVVGEYWARVVTPSFMHGRNQLSSEDVEVSRRVANVRIHVERVIGLVRRKYRILESKLNFSYLHCAPGELFARIDDVVVVCCALCNLCKPLIPMSDVSEAPCH